MQISSIWHINKNETKLVKSELPLTSNENKVFVKSTFSMVSTGTERLVINGRVPKAIEKKMQVPYMEGTFNFPLKYGYALAGLTEDGQKSTFAASTPKCLRC